MVKISIPDLETAEWFRNFVVDRLNFHYRADSMTSKLTDSQLLLLKNIAREFREYMKLQKKRGGK